MDSRYTYLQCTLAPCLAVKERDITLYYYGFRRRSLPLNETSENASEAIRHPEMSMGLPGKICT
jgi:hypothetical protein